MLVAESGYRFLELLEKGRTLQEASIGSIFVRRFVEGSVKPENKLEIDLSEARSMRQVYDVLWSNKCRDMFDSTGWPLAHKLAEYAVQEAHKNGANTYLYFFLVGLTLIGRNHQIKYCECCGWRFKRVGNSRYCSNCSSHTDEKNTVTTTRTRQQRRIFEGLKDSLEYQSFIKLRHLGENYPLLLLLMDKVPEAVKSMRCDLLDYTPFEDYRDAKMALAAKWDEYHPSVRVNNTRKTDAELIELALSGHNKASAAQQLGMSRAGVTKACQRNSKVAQAFLRKR